jgi:hypothetical protein
MTEFIIFIAFNVTIHSPKTPKFNEILWHPLLISWALCNLDGALHDILGNAFRFRGYQANFLSCYTSNISVFFIRVDIIFG